MKALIKRSGYRYKVVEDGRNCYYKSLWLAKLAAKNYDTKVIDTRKEHLTVIK